MTGNGSSPSYPPLAAPPPSLFPPSFAPAHNGVDYPHPYMYAQSMSDTFAPPPRQDGRGGGGGQG
jgi:hypothetical protein